MNKLSSVLFYTIAIIAFASAAQASSMVYHGMNSNITPTAPYNPTYLSEADRTRPYDPKSIVVIDENQQATQGLVNQYIAKLTGACPCPTITLGNTTYTASDDPITHKHVITITGPNGTTKLEQ